MEIMLQTSTLQEYKQLRGWCCVLDFHFGFVSFFVCLVLNLLLGFVCLFFILTKMTKKRVKKKHWKAKLACNNMSTLKSTNSNKIPR